MSIQCAKEKAAVHTQEVRVLELEKEVSESTGQAKKNFARQLLLARQDLDTAHRNLNACLAK